MFDVIGINECTGVALIFEVIIIIFASGFLLYMLLKSKKGVPN